MVDSKVFLFKICSDGSDFDGEFFAEGFIDVGVGDEIEVESGRSEFGGGDVIEAEFHDRPRSGISRFGVGDRFVVGAPATEEGIGSLIGGEFVDPDVIGGVECDGLGGSEEGNGSDHADSLTSLRTGCFVWPDDGLPGVSYGVG